MKTYLILLNQIIREMKYSNSIITDNPDMINKMHSNNLNNQASIISLNYNPNKFKPLNFS